MIKEILMKTTASMALLCVIASKELAVNQENGFFRSIASLQVKERNSFSWGSN